MPVTAIEEYVVSYASNTFAPRIFLRSGGNYVGQLVFLQNGMAKPVDNISGGIINLFYWIDNFPHCLDILRNEAPVYLFFNGPGVENGIRTVQEPVGEGGA